MATLEHHRRELASGFAPQRKDCAVGGDCRICHYSIASDRGWASHRHRTASRVPGAVRNPEVQAVDVVLIGREDETPPVGAERHVRHLEDARGERACSPARRGYRVGQQPPGLFPGKHELVVCGPQQVPIPKRRSVHAARPPIGGAHPVCGTGCGIRYPQRPGQA